jgi:mannose-6-phosphate isomerase-like protein (cupin superfamily)
MSIVRAAGAPRFEFNGLAFTVFAGPSNGSRQLCTWRLTVPAGHTSMPHTLDRDEVFMIHSGEVRLTPGGAVLRVGDGGVIPAGGLIAVENPGAEPAEVYVAVPAGFTPYTADGDPVPTPPWAA